MTVLEDDAAGCFEHEAFIYASDDEYVETLAPLMADALAAGDVVIAVVPGQRAALLRAELGTAADGVTWIEASEWYRQPVRTIAGYERTLQGLERGTSAFVVGEVQFGSNERDWRAWTRYEAALNRALERHAARVVCPYDARSLPPTVVDDARRTHRHLLERDERRASEGYVEPEALLRDMAADAVTPVGTPDVELPVGRSVQEARRAFSSAATAWGLPGSRAHELSVAVSEVVTNAVVHGGGAASLRIWCRDDGLTCVVEDQGTGSEDALLGYVPPAPGAVGGYGLWLTRQLFDRTELARSAGGGLLVLLAVDA
ncbi:MAG TPA: sensor histidine kinase [Acidimicrobiales bacterium]|nr:sensor histidine kinase [Acidimicrobiales bacterium]